MQKYHLQCILTFILCGLLFTWETDLCVKDGCCWLRGREGGLVGVILFLCGGIQRLSRVLLIFFKSLKIGTELAVAERGVLYSCLFNALQSHINHVLVQAFIDIGS